MSEKVIVERLTLRPTLACNFRCKLCNEYSPYYKPAKMPAIEQVLKDIDRTFELIDFIGKFEISGGEPLLYKPLPQIVSHMLQYNERFEFFSLVTNGSILFNEEVIKGLAAIGQKLRVIVDDYGAELSKNAHNNVKLLQTHHIRYELRDQYADVHADGWLDFSDFTLKHNEQQAKDLFSRCVCPQKLHWVVTLTNGQLYPCHFLRRCTELGIIPENPQECINLYDTCLTDAQLKQNIMGLYQLDVLTACKYCSGFVEGRDRKKPAEQLLKGEVV